MRLSMNDEYHSYLLRLWRSEPASSWRVSVESTRTGQRRQFTSVEELFEYILSIMAASEDAPPV